MDFRKEELLERKNERLISVSEQQRSLLKNHDKYVSRNSIIILISSLLILVSMIVFHLIAIEFIISSLLEVICVIVEIFGIVLIVFNGNLINSKKRTRLVVEMYKFSILEEKRKRILLNPAIFFRLKRKVGDLSDDFIKISNYDNRNFRSGDDFYEELKSEQEIL